MGNTAVMTTHSESHDRHPVGAVKEFVSYYHEEMHRNIDRLRQLCEKLVPGETPECLQEISAIGQAICDLAMVYGFETEELIGQQIMSAAQSYRQDADVEKLREKLLKTARAAEEAMFLMDEKGVLEEPEVESSPPETAQEPETPQEESREEPELLFDIREDEKLISLLSDADGEAFAVDLNTTEDDEIEVLDITSILPEEKKKSDFDIPAGEDQDSIQQLEDDILEIDFREPEQRRADEKKGFLKKLSGFLSRKGRNQISFQE